MRVIRLHVDAHLTELFLGIDDLYLSVDRMDVLDQLQVKFPPAIGQTSDTVQILLQNLVVNHRDRRS